ncbi:MBL fold metallo-hydrolase [Wenjunlia tyrosinilytica]|uniref:Metallo-hydrolase n=1 Tax=Wenjunlia tyrosinilytica TaxID=1544741 RepID=A0A917ZXC1_9ACTN|nr:MBL fold metallo-hydrolase [Wenjunlia tyrosinilytica]GGO96794.1 putative metallo-hydrolase [Wenjunlia tyrosinilytica]
MKVHHLNCGSMQPPGLRLVCHVLLMETANGLVLVDSGYGLDDVAHPRRRVGPVRFLTRPSLDAEETAARQVERLGFRREDVRHIVLTHFDADHIGGLSDFPHATVHATAAEVLGSVISPSLRERNRYRPAQWAHGPKIVEHRPDGEKWRGFAQAKELDAVAPGIVMVSLPGHTRGHACIAVDTGGRWILHAGDSFYHHGTLDGRTPVPAALRRSEAVVAYDADKVRDNHARLAELYRRAEPDLVIFNAHDPTLFEKMLSGA